ncbi:MAG: hypothetical protein HY842_04420 [Bacteroidetes bacterium]|nr:hypothetical protein [Bacteroidota bacterium]
MLLATGSKRLFVLPNETHFSTTLHTSLFKKIMKLDLEKCFAQTYICARFPRKGKHILPSLTQMRVTGPRKRPKGSWIGEGPEGAGTQGTAEKFIDTDGGKTGKKTKKALLGFDKRVEASTLSRR